MQRAGRAVLILFLAAPVPRLAGQSTPSQPRLYLTAFIGYRAGQPLWTLSNQPFAVLARSGDTAVVGSGQRDTLDLSRHLDPSFVVGASGTYFPHPHLGFQGELAFLGMGLESRCSIRQTQPPDPTDIDPQLCSSLNGQSVATSAVSVSVGLVGRATAGKGVFPYARADVGLIARTRGTIEMMGVYDVGNQVGTATVVADRSPFNTSLHFTFGAGVAVSAGTGYQVWFEARDVMTQLDRVNGQADPSDPSGSLFPPHTKHFFHNFVFAIGLDVVFEKQRGRRY